MNGRWLALAVVLFAAAAGTIAWTGYRVGATHGVCPPMGKLPQ